ncbi:MAG: hypothetical protein ACR2FN_01605 [Chitinophagaceae bacterium]
MKKWIIGIFIISVLSTVITYILIPNNIIISNFASVKCNSDGAFRSLSQINNWISWWPSNASDNAEDSIDKKKFLIYTEDRYCVTQVKNYIIDVLIEHNDLKINSTINLFPLSIYSVEINWKCTLNASLNPIKRIQQYMEAVKIKKNMADILKTLSSFLSKNENVYGIKIEKTSTKDTLLVATKSEFDFYPSNSNVYDLINILKKYINKQRATQTGYPIINITQLSAKQFQLMVAIPTNKELKNERNIFFKRMIPGNFYTTEVKGGNYTVNNALNNLQLYMQDYQNTEMAIPFEALITDRIMEPDSSKWITRIYQPTY